MLGFICASIPALELGRGDDIVTNTTGSPKRPWGTVEAASPAAKERAHSPR
jgi:hypothetical protein